MNASGREIASAAVDGLLRVLIAAGTVVGAVARAPSAPCCPVDGHFHQVTCPEVTP